MGTNTVLSVYVMNKAGFFFFFKARHTNTNE